MVMNGYDTDGDGENNFYTVNGLAFYYAKYPIRVKQGELVRIYLANLTEFDLINSLHLHGEFFRYYPTGSTDHFEYTDTVMLCQGERGIIEIEFHNTGTLHVPRAPERVRRARLDGLLRGERLSGVGLVRSEARRRALAALGARADRSRSSARSRSSSRPAGSLARPRRPEPAAARRARRPPGRVPARRDQDPGHEPAARRRSRSRSVTVDDAIVPFTVDGDRTLGRLRSATIVVPYDWVDGRADHASASRARPGSRRREEIAGRGRDAAGLGARLPRLRGDRPPRRRRCRSRSASPGCRRCAARARSGWPRSWR